MFDDRQDAGCQLADRLRGIVEKDTIVFALPRGGVPVAAEVARSLGAPLEVIVVRKLGAPNQPELGIGAIAEGGVRVVDPQLQAQVGAGDAAVEAVETRERRELERRIRRYRGSRPLPRLDGRTAVVVDDGLATGASARAACRAVRQLRPHQLVLAVPVAARGAVASLEPEVDLLVCLQVPARFLAVGHWYRSFDQTSDAEVVALLDDVGPPGVRAS